MCSQVWAVAVLRAETYPQSAPRRPLAIQATAARSKNKPLTYVY